MRKKVIIISTSIRANSNSKTLAKSFADGAASTCNEVSFVSLKDKNIHFCKGCLACQSIGSCVIRDDVSEIMELVLNADVVVWATPIYYYEMSGQMKTLIDRLNPMFTKDYKFREVYFLATAAEDAEHVYQRAMEGLQGWIDCYEKSALKGYVFCGSVTMGGEIKSNGKMQAAFDMGAGV